MEIESFNSRLFDKWFPIAKKRGGEQMIDIEESLLKIYKKYMSGHSIKTELEKLINKIQESGSK